MRQETLDLLARRRAQPSAEPQMQGQPSQTGSWVQQYIDTVARQMGIQPGSTQGVPPPSGFWKQQFTDRLARRRAMQPGTVPPPITSAPAPMPQPTVPAPTAQVPGIGQDVAMARRDFLMNRVRDRYGRGGIQ